MYHGADHPSYTLAKIGGFFLLPALGALATRLAAPAAAKLAPETNPAHVTAVVGTLAYAGMALACYKASESDSLSESMQSAFRGGMWGSGVAGAVVAAAPAISTPGPLVSGTLPAVDAAFNLLTAQAAGAVAASRVKSAFPALR